MADTQLSSKLGSDNSIFGLKEFNNVKKSGFNFTRKHFTTVDIGGIYPIDHFRVFPGDKVKLNLRYLLDTFPLEVPTMTNYFVRTHWYYIKMSSLWEGWETFITRGRSGNVDLTIPAADGSDIVPYQIAKGEFGTSDGAYITDNGPCSLSSYLGLNSKYYNGKSANPSYLPFINTETVGTSDFSTTGKSLPSAFNILPLFAYQKICRYNYMPINLLQDNNIWFPVDMHNHWTINYSASNLRDGKYYVPEGASLPTAGTEVARFVPSADASTGDNCVDLWKLRYGLFGNDYFTTAKPWLVRGNEDKANLDLSIDDIVEGIQLEAKSNAETNNGVFLNAIAGTGWEYLKLFQNGTDSTKLDITKTTSLTNLPSNNYTLGLKSLVSGLTTVGTSLSANTMRNLLALSVWRERNTLTNGNYNSNIQVHWGQKPHAPEFEPLYIGGTTDLISFGQVLQTSASESGKPLGTKGGIGSASGGASVFDFDVTDHGYIMGVMIISPEVVYTQGIDRDYTDLTFDSQLIPEFANLGYQPIYNQEIFVSGNDTYDKGLFGYQTRYAYLKQRENKVSGLFELNSTQDNVFGPYVQARRFAQLPALSNQFVTMSPDNIDRSFLSFPNLPAFKLQFASDIKLVRALPYQSTPNTFGF